MLTQMEQYAPYPEELRSLVAELRYKPSFEFTLEDSLDRGQGSVGATLVVTITTPNSYDQEHMRRVAHYFPVPPAAFLRSSWQRWLLDQVLLVEQHEACEFFEVGGEKPYAPNHGPGHDPYCIRELTTDEDRRTAYTGAVKPPTEQETFRAEELRRQV